MTEQEIVELIKIKLAKQYLIQDQLFEASKARANGKQLTLLLMVERNRETIATLNDLLNEIQITNQRIEGYVKVGSLRKTNTKLCKLIYYYIEKGKLTKHYKDGKIAYDTKEWEQLRRAENEKNNK